MNYDKFISLMHLFLLY